MPIDPNLVSTITIPQLASLGLTADTLFPHQVVGGKMKKATLAVLTAYLQLVLNFENKIILEWSELNLIEDVDAGSWYIEFKNEDGSALGETVRPYFVESKQGDHTFPIPPMLENDEAWAFPRIYGFPSSSTTQDIKIFAL